MSLAGNTTAIPRLCTCLASSLTHCTVHSPPRVEPDHGPLSSGPQEATHRALGAALLRAPRKLDLDEEPCATVRGVIHPQRSLAG